MNLVIKLRCQNGLRLWHCPVPQEFELPGPGSPLALAESLRAQGLELEELKAPGLDPQSDQLMFELFDLENPPQFIDEVSLAGLGYDTLRLWPQERLARLGPGEKLLAFGLLEAQYWEFFASLSQEFRPSQVRMGLAAYALEPGLKLKFVSLPEIVCQGQPMQELYFKSLFEMGVLTPRFYEKA